MLYFPEKSASEGAKFALMVDEIHEYMVYVLKEHFGWHSITDPQLSTGSGHVVIRFEKDGNRMVFRVPKYGAHQLKRSMLAYRHFGALGFMPEKLYQDGKCILESFVEGAPLGSQVRDIVIADLAKSLSAMHCIPACGFGPLDWGVQGHFADANAFYAAQRAPTVDRSELDLSAHNSATLNVALAQAQGVPAQLQDAPCFMAHGDLWRRNILVNQQNFKIIDWDRIGAYPVEFDLGFLFDVEFSFEQRQLFFTNYAHPVNTALLKWFANRNVLRNSGLRLEKKLEKIRAINLL